MSDFDSIDNSTDDPDYMSEQSGITCFNLIAFIFTLLTKILFSCFKLLGRLCVATETLYEKEEISDGGLQT